MQYHEAVNFLFDLRRFQVKPGTESVRDLLARVGDPQEGVAFVQVAGSNGKGSTARMVEAVLREAGHRVGLYTSPHFEDVRERVRVDGRKIPERAVCEFVDEVKPFLVERAAAGEPLTFFEVVTAMGIWQFGRADVDVAVLEVGMGGELDATSVVDPVAAAVTNVSLEHTAVLGDTVEEIAETKARIAPADRPLVTATTGRALATVRDVAGDVVTVGEAAMDDATGGGEEDETEPGDDEPDVRVTYEGRTNHAESAVTLVGGNWRVEARIPLVGAYQATNAGVAAVLARQAGAVLSGEAVQDEQPDAGSSVDDATLVRGLRRAHWPGRFEVMARDPMVVLDGAHNPDACGTLAGTLAEFDYDDLHLVFAAMHDKDHDGMVAALPTPDSVTTCRPTIDRAEDPEVLATVFREAGVSAEAVSHRQSVASALAAARERAEPGDCVLVAGSLFCVAEARATWTRVQIPKRVRDIDEARETLERAHVTDPGVWRMRGKAVHRVVKTRVQRRQAQYLKEELLSLGGECATAGLRTDAELTDVVLMGTMAQFKRLAEKLDDQPWGLAAVADELRAQLGIQTRQPWEAPDAGYPWSDGPAVMGVLNVTPDSFHDGGEFFDVGDAVARAESMVEAGVDIVDVGGESTRPGAEEVPEEAERERVVPVVEALADLDVAVSVDTRKPSVARAALDAGADILNDVTGLEDAEMRYLAAEREVPVVLMHSVDAPVVPDKRVEYDDVVEDVVDELVERVLLAEKAGIPRERIVVDPGLGFGKTRHENYELLDRLGELKALGCPVLVGHSHKSMFELAGEEPGDAPHGTVAATALAVDRGADVVRVHDVAENVAAVRVAQLARGDDVGE